jgi:hypothetical protein
VPIERPEPAHDPAVKRKAHRAVRDAIRDGILRPGPCEVCGSTLDIHAHHDDYSRPLDVIWLCASHHMQLHSSSNFHDKVTREMRLWLPVEVVEWLDGKAREHFKSRNAYISDILVQLYRKREAA